MPAHPTADRWWVLLPALPLAAVCVGGTHGAAATQSTVASPGAYVLALAAALTLVLRRGAPLLGIAAAALATAAYLLLDQPYGPILLVGPVWACCLALRLPPRRAVPWLAGFVAVVVAAAAPTADGGWEELLAGATFLALLVTAGASTGFALSARKRSESAARAEVARRAVSEERLAMAQDVHDGVGHSLAVIALHAGVAAHVLDRDPARAKELLRTMASTSREALDGLRTDLDRLRSQGAAARAPGPGLADLPLLLDRMRDGGLRLTVTLDPPEEVPPEVGAAAYRIVQESLTNVLRHAGTAEAKVLVLLLPRTRRLFILVTDQGAGPGPAAGGTGIAGMRRRAEAVGGTLAAEPGHRGGFRVRAVLPL